MANIKYSGESKEAPMSATDFSKLSRPIQPMPEFVLQALVNHGLLDAYRDRPPYQQNDYLSWINRAKRVETKEKRLGQMLAELARGDLYMKMAYRPSRKRQGCSCPCGAIPIGWSAGGTFRVFNWPLSPSPWWGPS